jgi:hypothetical protein
MLTSENRLERFPAKWIPVRVKKTRQNKDARAPFGFNRNGKGSRQADRHVPISRACPTAATLSLGGVPFHDRDTSVDLVGYHFPASVKAGQNRSFSATLRQEQEPITFFGLRPATACFGDFPPSIKKGQWRPPRYTRSRMTKGQNR